jgi:hypothetical protein
MSNDNDKTRTKYFRQPLDPHGYTHYIKVWEKLITPSGAGIMRKNLQEASGSFQVMDCRSRERQAEEHLD